VAAAAMLWWRATDADWIDAWMPNIITGLLAIAVTITLVEGIIQREGRERVKPQLNPILRDIGIQLRSLVAAVAVDYVATHHGNYERLPNHADEVIAHWQGGLRTIDMTRVGGTSAIFNFATAFAGTLERLEQDYRRELDDAEFGAAVLSFGRAARRNAAYGAITEAIGGSKVEKSRAECEHLSDFSDHALALAEEYARMAQRLGVEDMSSLSDEEIAEIERR
jgi:hypothetical protein